MLRGKNGHTAKGCAASPTRTIDELSLTISSGKGLLRKDRDVIILESFKIFCNL